MPNKVKDYHEITFPGVGPGVPDMKFTTGKEYNSPLQNFTDAFMLDNFIGGMIQNGFTGAGYTLNRANPFDKSEYNVFDDPFVD